MRVRPNQSTATRDPEAQWCTLTLACRDRSPQPHDRCRCSRRGSAMTAPGIGNLPSDPQCIERRHHRGRDPGCNRASGQ